MTNLDYAVKSLENDYQIPVTDYFYSTDEDATICLILNYGYVFVTIDTADIKRLKVPQLVSLILSKALLNKLLDTIHEYDALKEKMKEDKNA